LTSGTREHETAGVTTNDSLTTEDEAILAVDREFLPAVLDARFPGAQLTGGVVDLPLMQQIYDGGPYTNDAISEVIALGTAFGDVIARSLGMSWVRYCDDDGEELALRYENSDLVVFPRTLLLTRLEEGGAINLTVIYEEVCAKVRQKSAPSN
jgi:hypothetical protein